MIFPAACLPHPSHAVSAAVHQAVCGAAPELLRWTKPHSRGLIFTHPKLKPLGFASVFVLRWPATAVIFLQKAFVVDPTRWILQHFMHSALFCCWVGVLLSSQLDFGFDISINKKPRVTFDWGDTTSSNFHSCIDQLLGISPVLLWNCSHQQFIGARSISRQRNEKSLPGIFPQPLKVQKVKLGLRIYFVLVARTGFICSLFSVLIPLPFILGHFILTRLDLFTVRL